MKKLLPFYCFAALTLGMSACKKDKKNDDPLLARWQWEYFALDNDGDGTISEDEKMLVSDGFLTFNANGNMVFEEELGKYPSTYERSGDQITIYLNFFGEGPGTIKTLDKHTLVIDYAPDGTLLEYGLKK
jgi:hypothetical protein